MMSYQWSGWPTLRPTGSDQTECLQTAKNTEENPQERQEGGRPGQRRANKMVSNEDDSRREQQKCNRSTNTGLSDEREAADHIYDRRTEWSCREPAGPILARL